MSYQSQAAPHLPIPVYNPMAAINAPAGTFLPGTKVQVGSHRVVVEKYLSEGGFAHVYVVRLPQPVDGSDRAVLKRVAVPDKAALANMRTEVETMKKLKGHRHIVTYIDSHASQLQGGGYEVFLLMEFCAGGGLIDFMNTRLQNRLTEPEIIKIFSDVAEGVACMHYLKPPLLHRDLKVENVLISRHGGSTIYKLCDFGSTAPPRPAATSAAEGRLIEDDVQRHTTLQYRSPEMIDVYRKQPIDEKSDIWALGVLLYKLCYYTTPFEEVGQMAILNASYKFPSYPPFSDRLKMLIAWMLKEHPQKRPNIFEVVREICHMQGKDVPIRDIYANRSTSEARRYQELPPSPTETPQVGAVFSPPMQETQIIPEIAPMRRGRPTRPTPSQHNSAKPSPSPFRGGGDPFSVLDAGNRQRESADEFSNRFPSLDQFQILHEKGGKFDFEPTVSEKTEDDDLAQRLTNALADDAFAKHPAAENDPLPKTTSEPTIQRRPQPAPIKTKSSEVIETYREEARPQVPLYQPVPQKPAMVSTGTMTSPPATPGVPNSKPSSRPIFKFPSSDHQRRPSSQPWPTEADKKAARQSKAPSPTSSSFPNPRVSNDRISDLSASPRPSLDGLRPTNLDVEEPARSRSANSRSRPVSVHASARFELPRGSESARSSLDLPRSPKAQSPVAEEFPKPVLPSAEVTAEPASDLIEMDSEDISPEMRRELERRRLSQEEKRVAKAAEEYRRRVAEGGAGGFKGGDGPRSQAIQSKVQSLLSESNRPPVPPKTATGYGRYTDESSAALQAKPTEARPDTRGSRVSGTTTSSMQERYESRGLPRQETASTGYAASQRTGSSRPALPPKPKGLRVGGIETRTESQPASPTVSSATTAGDDWEANFSRRFPSLSGLEMETEIEMARVPLRTREI
ncbi:serine/threonine protein kinase [Aspergillus luchuensis]|uniref:non-specific serine/threonine protein kinase n=1 Tax=Aspergillus kawachii TaxID=1069201 RepID=A0A146F593_ASPKA|nr:serine/threonine protein kinase [Aspergillus luchuensis]